MAVETDADVRTSLALQIGVLNRPADDRILARVARSDSDPVVRLAAALAWVHLRSDRPPAEAVRLIEEAIEQSGDLRARLPKNDFVIDRAFEVLASTTEAGLRVLLAQAKSPSVEMRKAALQQLAGLEPCPPAAVAGVVQALSDPSADVRAWAAFLLGYLGSPVIMCIRVTKQYARLETLEAELAEPATAAVVGLAARLKVKRNPEVRDTIWRALKDLALWATPILRPVPGRSDDAREALAFIAALRRADPAELCRLLDQAHGRYAWTIGRVLVRVARLRPDSVVPLLTQRLGSFPAAVEMAARLLGEIGPAARAAVPALRNALRHSDEAVRNAATEALHRIEPGTGGLPAKPSASAIRARLGQSAPRKLVRLVGQLLDNSQTGQQWRALWQIAQMGEPATPALRYLRDAMQKDWLRYDAAGAIARLEPESIRPMLPELLRDFRQSKLEGDFADRALDLSRILGPETSAGRGPIPARLPAGSRPAPRPAATMIPHALDYLGTAEPGVLLPLIVRLLQTRWEQEAGVLGPVPPVLRFLKKRGTPYARAVDAVAGKLKNPELSLLALETLSRIGSWTTASRYLVRFLTSEEEAGRKAAEAGLRRLAKSATVADLPALRRAAGHKRNLVAGLARVALERLARK